MRKTANDQVSCVFFAPVYLAHVLIRYNKGVG